MIKVRINDLARELEVKSKAILDALAELGFVEHKTHSSPIDEEIAAEVRRFIRGDRTTKEAASPQEPPSPASPAAWITGDRSGSAGAPATKPARRSEPPGVVDASSAGFLNPDYGASLDPRERPTKVSAVGLQKQNTAPGAIRAKDFREFGKAWAQSRKGSGDSAQNGAAAQLNLKPSATAPGRTVAGSTQPDPLLKEMQQRFGDFFGMKLVAVDELFWPVFVHRLSVWVRKSQSLDVLEEGMLRLAIAGVNKIEEVADFLGCSLRYARRVAHDLATTSDGMIDSPPLAMAGDEISVTPNTAQALGECRKVLIERVELSALRDAIFDLPLDQSKSEDDKERFIPMALDRSAASPARWLGACAAATAKDPEALAGAIEVCGLQEIVCSELEQTGTIKWVKLYLGSYQPDSGAAGRYLLFNPNDDDRPLPTLSKQFEKRLKADGTFKTYLADDRLATIAEYWSALASRVRTREAATEIDQIRVAEECAPPQHSGKSRWCIGGAWRRWGCSAIREHSERVPLVAPFNDGAPLDSASGSSGRARFGHNYLPMDKIQSGRGIPRGHHNCTIKWAQYLDRLWHAA